MKARRINSIDKRADKTESNKHLDCKVALMVEVLMVGSL